ncbi:hypothetical protein [Myxococcus qinghaiensis]|nr:hypothetical protein [Myxococcus qinghaiensis]
MALQLVMGLLFAFMLGLSPDARESTRECMEDSQRAKSAKPSREV